MRQYMSGLENIDDSGSTVWMQEEKRSATLGSSPTAQIFSTDGAAEY